MTGKRRRGDLTPDVPTSGAVLSSDVSDLDESLQSLQSLDEAVVAKLTQALEKDIGWQLVQRKAKKRKSEADDHKKPQPSVYHTPAVRLNTHVKIGDLQQLALYILAHDKPIHWVTIQNPFHIEKVVVLLVPGIEFGMFNDQIALHNGTDTSPTGLSLPAPAHNGAESASRTSLSSNLNLTPKKSSDLTPDDYYPVRISAEKLPAPVKAFATIFPHVWPIKAPGDDKMTRLYSPLYAMLQTQFQRTDAEKKVKGPLLPAAVLKHFENKRTPVTHYLAGMDELVENGYALHPAMATTDATKKKLLAKRQTDLTTAEHGWIDTRITDIKEADVPESEVEAGSILGGREIIALDCEFCKTDDGEYALTRVSLVNWEGSTILDELVKPERPIVDYVTLYSGITEKMLVGVTTTLADIQKRLLEIITPRTILMGHSLESDFNALKLTHPFIVDTALLFPARGTQKQALRFLTKRFLGREIQNRGAKGHDSTEDAIAVLDLVKQKCERGPLWGSSDGNSEPIFKRLKRTVRSNTTKGATDEAATYRTGAMLDWGHPHLGPGVAANKIVACQSDEDVVEGVKSIIAAEESSDEHMDFIFGRLRELEAIRGWWPSTKTGNSLDELRESVLKKYSVPDPELDSAAPNVVDLAAAVTRTADHVAAIYASLPANTLFIVYTGHGDAREVARLNALETQFRREYATKKWSELTVRWTDAEVQARRKAVRRARMGAGFIVVKQ